MAEESSETENSGALAPTVAFWRPARPGSANVDLLVLLRTSRTALFRRSAMIHEEAAARPMRGHLSIGICEGCMNVLVIGSGAREHALVWALCASPLLGNLWCAPGN